MWLTVRPMVWFARCPSSPQDHRARLARAWRPLVRARYLWSSDFRPSSPPGPLACRRRVDWTAGSFAGAARLARRTAEARREADEW